MDRRGVLFEPQARAALSKGMATLARLLAATLGPMGHAVAVAPVVGRGAPELLDDAATVARRIIELRDPYETAGAMLLRHLAWRMRVEVGDGAATAAVLAAALVDQLRRALAAGASPVLLRRGVEEALQVAVETLRQQSAPVEGLPALQGLATAAAGDERMGRLIAEMLDVLGPEGEVLVHEQAGVGLDREYVEGVRWNRGYVSPYFVTNAERQEAIVERPFILLTDLDLTTVEQVQPALEAVARANGQPDALGGRRGLVVVASRVVGAALQTLVANHQRGALPCLALEAPAYGEHRIGILHDLAVLTGARVFLEAAGERTERALLTDLGQARLVRAGRDWFTIVGGLGDPAAIRRRRAEVRSLLPTMKEDADRSLTRERLGKLGGGVAILHVGATTEVERKALALRAEAAIAATRAALEEGVVPGGGVAYLACIPHLEAAAQGADLPDVAWGIRALAAALQAPTRAIARNAGADPKAVVARLRAEPLGVGFDARRGAFVDMRAAGIVDPLKVARLALEKAASGAVLAMTSEAIVLTDKSRSSNQASQP